MPTNDKSGLPATILLNINIMHKLVPLLMVFFPGTRQILKCVSPHEHADQYNNSLSPNVIPIEFICHQSFLYVLRDFYTLHVTTHSQVIPFILSC